MILYAYVTFTQAIPSPKSGNTEFTFAADPASRNGGFTIERDGDTVAVGYTPKGIVEHVPWSQVRNARILTKEEPKPKAKNQWGRVPMAAAEKEPA